MKQNIYAYVVTVAFFLQALIPVGFMPALADGGNFMVICSGITGEAIKISIDDPLMGDNDEQESSICLYSAVGTGTEILSSYLAVLDAPYATLATKYQNVFVARLTASSHHTRGPPDFSLI